MLETLSQYSQGQGFHFRHRVLGIDAVSQYAGQLRNFGQPATIVFLLVLDTEIHGDSLQATPGEYDCNVLYGEHLMFDMGRIYRPAGGCRLDAVIRFNIFFGMQCLQTGSRDTAYCDYAAGRAGYLFHPHSGLRTRVWLEQQDVVAVWAGAHLLANGDLASLVLFGGLGSFALVDMWLANKRGAVRSAARQPV